MANSSLKCAPFLILALALGCGKQTQPAPRGSEQPDETPAPVFIPPKQKLEPPLFVGVRWVAGTEEEEAALVSHLPEQIRKLFGNDFNCFSDLEGKAWAFEYTGGPVRCWLEIEETGQSTAPKRYPPPAPDGPGEWEGKGAKGRIVLWMRRDGSERVNQVLRRAGRDPLDTSTVSIGCTITSDKGGSNSAASLENPLWYGWKEHTFVPPPGPLQLPSEVPLPDDKPGVVLEGKATEAVEEGRPRQVKLAFKVQRVPKP
jgi:hypothetical protein